MSKIVNDIYQINVERLQQDLEQLGSIGKSTEGGVSRSAFSEFDMQGRQWLKAQAVEAGLHVREDGAANIIISLRERGSEPAVITGSHIDTVPDGGQLDGALGVVSGLEALRVISEQNIECKRPIEVISFSDEEGRFGGMLGSLAFSGKLSPGYLDKATDSSGRSLVGVLKDNGYNPMDFLKASRVPQSIAAFVELHIEQGPVLETYDAALGVVESIAGLFKWHVRLIGAPNHSGTTPMAMRKDAMQGLAEIVREAPRILEENGSTHSVWNIGRVELFPGAANVVPGEAHITLEVRDGNAQVLGDLGFAFRKAISAIARRRELMFEYEVISDIQPVKCDRKVVSVLESTVRDLGLEAIRMMSGAAHDAQNIAKIAPTAMLFIASKGGISHSPAEWSDWQDIENGATTLLNTLVRLSND